MAFPQSPLGVKVQLNLAGLGWTDVTRYDASTRLLQDTGVTISRGKSDTDDRVGASTCTWSWLDPNGVYSNDNPRSPYFGILPRNTPVRVLVPRATAALLIVDVNDAAQSRTVDKAALDVVGDLDLRIDIEPARFRRWDNDGTTHVMQLVGKYTTPNRSWVLRLRNNGLVEYLWSTAGTGANQTVSTVALPTTGRIAIKVFHDVDNGAAGNTVTFSTASSINGSYTVLGAPVVSAGITTIFSGTADVEIGSVNNAQVNGTAFRNFVGRVYGFQMRNSAGTLVATPDFSAQANGTTSFSDGLGNTWTNSGVAEITSNDYRFYGELSAPAQEPDSTGRATKVNVEASGLIRRLTTNSTPLQSPIYRNFNTYTPSGWWPGEDGSGATQASSAVTGADAAPITDITFSGYDSGLAGSAGVMTLGSTGPVFTGVAKAGAPSAEAHFYAYYKFPSVPLSAQTMFTIYGDGAVKKWEWIPDATGYTTKGYDSTGVQTVTKSTAFGAGAEPDKWLGFHLQITQNGANVDIKVEWHVVGTGTFYTQNIVGTLSVAGTVGRFTSVVVQGIAALSGVKMAHLLLTSNTTNRIFFDPIFSAYSKGYVGETAAARFIRICLEQGIQSVIVGTATDTELMGAQPIDEVMNILYQTAEVDGGYLSEARDQLALVLRTRSSMLNQYGLPLSITVSKHLSDTLKSTPDDLNIKNDVTVNRTNGGSARAVLESGAMSVLAPTAGGIGRVPDEVTINNYVDTRLPALAQWRLFRGTWPEARYPTVKISLHRSPYTYGSAIFNLASSTDLADYLSVSDLPVYLPPDPLEFMVQGVTEEISAFNWDISWNTSPYGIFKANEMSTVVGEESRLDGTTTLLKAAITSTATSFVIKTPITSQPWADTTSFTAEFPISAKIGGEKMTFTAITAPTSVGGFWEQTVTATRSVNGIVKAQIILAPVFLFRANYLTL
jgi:hypothetical protein